MVKKNIGPFPSSHELNQWADQVPGSRDSVTRVVGQTSNKVRSISNAKSAGNLWKHKRKFGTGFVNSKRIKNLDLHKY